MLTDCISELRRDVLLNKDALETAQFQCLTSMFAIVELRRRNVGL